MPIASAAAFGLGSDISSHSSLMSDNNGYRLAQNEDSYKGAEEFSQLRQKCGEIIDDKRTNTFILFLIALSSIMIGVGTSPAIKENPSSEKAFEIVDLVIQIVFTIESLLHFIFLGFRRFVKDRWLVFDFTIVIISWIAIEVPALKAFRVFRAWRFVTQVTRLRNVVVAVLSIMPAIGAIVTLLLLVLYIFTVMFTSLFSNAYKDGLTEQDYFGGLVKTIFTLSQVLCLDEWSMIGYELNDMTAWVILVVFIVISAFVVLNLLVAVICDALKILREAENKMLMDKLRGLENIDGEEMFWEEGEEISGEEESVDDERNESIDRVKERVDDMQRMLDELVKAQEDMAKTLQYLSLALYAQSKSEELMTIRETISHDSLSLEQ